MLDAHTVTDEEMVADPKFADPFSRIQPQRSSDGRSRARAASTALQQREIDHFPRTQRVREHLAAPVPPSNGGVSPSPWPRPKGNDRTIRGR